MTRHKKGMRAGSTLVSALNNSTRVGRQLGAQTGGLVAPGARATGVAAAVGASCQVRRWNIVCHRAGMLEVGSFAFLVCLICDHETGLRLQRAQIRAAAAKLLERFLPVRGRERGLEKNRQRGRTIPYLAFCLRCGLRFIGLSYMTSYRMRPEGDRGSAGVAAAGIITIANWQTGDETGARGTGRGVEWCRGITRMGLRRGKGGGSAAAGWRIGRGRREEG